MEINHLQEFLSLMETQSYVDTSEQMFISISTLIRHMTKLEQELNAPLFYPSSSKARPRESAYILLPYARELVARQDSCLQALTQNSSKYTGHLRIGAIGLEASAYNIYGLISEFRRDHPMIELHIEESETLSLCESLKNNSLDFAFIFMPESNRETMHYLPVVNDHLAVLISGQNTLSQKDSMSVEELNGKTLIPRPKSYLYDYTAMILNENQVTMKYYSEFSPSTANLLTLINENMGISIMPKMAAEYILRNPGSQNERYNITVLDLDPPADSTVVLAYMKSIPLTNSMKIFLQFMKNRIRNNSGPFADN